MSNWRVVTISGSVHTVEVVPKGGGWSTTENTGEWFVSPILAVLDLCVARQWQIVEVVAPGSQTADERARAAYQRGAVYMSATVCDIATERCTAIAEGSPREAYLNAIRSVTPPVELIADREREAVAAMHDACVKACRATAGKWADHAIGDGTTIDDFRFDDEACEYAEIGARDCVMAVRALRPQTPEESTEG